jgi:DNA-binding FadR family transcriptional regulator
MTPADLPTLSVQRVQSSYIQVADQLRELIIHGSLAPGRRLPPEAELAPMFGVSRLTVREALRILATDGLVITKRGVRGGTFVIKPDADHVGEVLNTTLNMLVLTDQVAPDDFLDAWMAIEAPAARLAALRRTDEHVANLRALLNVIPADANRRDAVQRSATDFHFAVLKASGNMLLEAMGRPVSAVARARLSQTDPTQAFWRAVNEDHALIAEAIAAGDADAAHDATCRHINALRPFYAAQLHAG